MELEPSSAFLPLFVAGKNVEVMALGDGDLVVVLFFRADGWTAGSRDNSSSLESSTVCGGCMVREVFEADCILLLIFDEGWRVS